jgi:uncharacterized protein RhaS with RHS repeats
VPETGLYHVGAREYDPRTARWLQRDPIDSASGDPNLYRYCGNDPINRADPSGLDALENAAHFAAGWGDRLTNDLTKHIRDWLCDLLDLPRWEPRDPCDEWYLAGHLVGAVHDRLLTRGAGGGLGFAKRSKRAQRAADTADEGILSTSRAARREAQRRAGIPTSQQPTRQGGSGDYRWYEYQIPTEGGGTQEIIVQHHPADENHPYPHWEVGPKKPGTQPNPRLRGPRYGGGRSKIRVPYRR